jgi:flagellar biosynthesis/type III secretory pathway M-ring protein FliF/YscJ
MKRRKIKIKFLVFILSVILIVILLIVRGITKKTDPPFQQNDENVENDYFVTATINAEEENGELEASEESESEEESSDVGYIFKSLIKGAKQQETVGKLISEDPGINFKELNDRALLNSKRKEIDS